MSRIIIMLMILQLFTHLWEAKYTEKTNDYASGVLSIENQEDLAEPTPIILPTPSYEYYLSEQALSTEINPIKLEMRVCKANEITDDEKWFYDNEVSISKYQIPISTRQIPGNLPDFINPKFSDLIITDAFYDDEYVYCVYGPQYASGRILKVYSAGSHELIISFDFTNYYLPGPGNKVQYINWAQIENNVLYISHSHGFASENSNNMNAYITAINLNDFEIIWRTKPLVSNTYNFLIIDGVIVSGYGYTNESDYLYQINKTNGEVIDQMPLKSAIDYIIEKDNSLYIRTYNTDYIFDISKKDE